MKRENDLNSKSAKSMLPQLVRKEMADEWWQIDLFTTDGLSTLDPVPRMRGPLPGRLQTQELLLLGPVSLHGFRPTNLPRKLARYRSLSTCQPDQALSYGHSRSRLAQHPGQRQLGPGLAHLCRLRSSAYQAGQRALPPRRVQPGLAANCLRTGRHHYRFVPVVDLK